MTRKFHLNTNRAAIFAAPAALILLFFLLLLLTVPDGAVFGSHLDWMSQHATLAETIRDACIDQGTLLPSWLKLGGGSNGYMFSYYGYLRPDIMIGCLLPQIPMIDILMAYMICIFLASVLLFYCFLRAEDISVPYAFGGSILFMTAGCLFHMHRQIMFVNYLPFLLLAFLCIRKRRIKWLPLCLCLIWLHSFYYIIGVLAATGWYWFRMEGRDFLKKYFLKGYITSALLSAGMAAALLIPTGLVILEHRRAGSSPSLLELLGPNVAFNNLLFNEYGMGLSFICFYAVLAGLKRKLLRQDSILFLLLGLFGIFSYVLNGTLYARPKILIPFMPLMVLHCVRFFQQERAYCESDQEGVSSASFPRWPFAVMIPIGLLWFSQVQFPFILLELFLLLCFCLLQKTALFAPAGNARIPCFFPGVLAFLLTMTAPAALCLETARTEEWVSASEISAGLTRNDAEPLEMDRRYRFDSLVSPLESSNELPITGQPRSSMYSSVTNGCFSAFYYDTLMTPIRINNRVALLTSENPFLLNLMGVRYLETTRAQVPAGYKIVWDASSSRRDVLQNDDTVIAENKNVLPIVYFTDRVMPESLYSTLDPYEKLDALTRFTVIQDSNAEIPETTFRTLMESWQPELILPALPDGLSVTRTSDGYEINAERATVLTADLSEPVSDKIILLSFHVESLTSQAVVIDINGIRNKLSNRYAPYPNGNHDFHYQFSPTSGKGIRQLKITLPKGRYVLSDFEWHLYSQELLHSKPFTPLADSGKGNAARPETVQKGQLHTESDGYIVTSIPFQKGLEILIDGISAKPVTVNEAFLGAYIRAGTHSVEIRFHPPGKTAGCALSILSVCAYVFFLAGTFITQKKQKKKEGLS